MKFKLRPYQMKAANAMMTAVKDGHQRILYVGPAGTGKGSQIAAMMAKLASMNNRVFFSVHRRDLVEGPNALTHRLMSQLQVPENMIGYALSGYPLKHRPIMVGTINSALNRKLSWNKASTFKYIFIDEAHRVKPPVPGKKDGMYAQLIKRYPDSIIFGFTATPERYSKHEVLGKIFSKCIQGLTHREAVRLRYLVPSNIIQPITPDLDGIKMRMTKDGRDYDEKELERRHYNDLAIEKLCDKIAEYAPGKCGIVYTINSIAICNKVADALRRRGFRVGVITSKTPKRTTRTRSKWDRVGVLEQLRDGELDLVVNVNILVEGISIDRVNLIVTAFSTVVMSKWQQAVPRGARPLWGPDGDWLKDRNGNYVKTEYLVLDCGNNATRLGSPESYLELGVNIHEPPKPIDPNAKPPMKRCPNCMRVIMANARQCPECGFNFPEKDDDRLFADQVEWKEYQSQYELVMRYRSLSDKQLIAHLYDRRMPEILMPLAVLKHPSNPYGWAVAMASKAGYYKGLDPRIPADWDTIANNLDRRTTLKGYRPIIDEILKNDVML